VVWEWEMSYFGSDWCSGAAEWCYWHFWWYKSII